MSFSTRLNLAPPGLIDEKTGLLDSERCHRAIEWTLNSVTPGGFVIVIVPTVPVHDYVIYYLTESLRATGVLDNRRRANSFIRFESENMATAEQWRRAFMEELDRMGVPEGVAR